MRPIREITEENFRVIDSIEPEPVGTYVALVFKIIGYDKDCDESLMARLAHVDHNGDITGATMGNMGLYPDCAVVLDSPSQLHGLAKIK